MRVHHANETAYTAYGVGPSSGALAVVRSDGYVGTIAKLEAVSRVDKYLSRCLVTMWILGR
jgi:phenol 2-monooxygenase